jgi:hypothetical protein
MTWRHGYQTGHFCEQAAMVHAPLKFLNRIKVGANAKRDIVMLMLN